MEIHGGIGDLAQEVSRRDGVELQLRIGLNSGQVITREIGTAATGNTAIWEQLDLAQRMESVAPLASFFKQLTQAVERRDEFSLGAGAHQYQRRERADLERHLTADL